MNTGKKALFVVLSVLFCTAALFAQSAGNADEFVPDVNASGYNEVEIINENPGHLVTFRIEYWPSVDEARFTYSKPSSLFDRGDAYAAVVERIMKFQLQHSYFSYTYMSRDQLHFDKDSNPERTLYSAYVKFER